MTQKHTTEPWAIHEDASGDIFISGSDHTYIAEIGNPDEDGAAADARRIVACVNALAGVTTEELEEAAALGIKDPRTGNLFSSRLKLERKIAEVSVQFNELLDLLKSLENDAGQIPQFMWTKIQNAVKKHTGETK